MTDDRTYFGDLEQALEQRGLDDDWTAEAAS